MAAGILGRALPQGGIGRKLLTVVTGVAAGHLVTSLAMPFVSRLYSPGDFGSLGVYLAVLGVVGVISTLCYELGIPMVVEEQDARSLLVVSLVCAFLMGVITLAGILVLRELRPQVLAPLGRGLWFLPLGVIGVGAGQALTNWGLRLQAYTMTARAKFTQNAGGALLQVGAGLARLGPAGLIAGDAFGRFSGAGSLLSLGSAYKDLLRLFSEGRRHLRTARAYRRFPQFSMADRLCDGVGMNGIVLLIAFLFGPWATGQFSFAMRLVGLPAALLGQVVGQVYIGEISKVVRESQDAFRPMFRNTIAKLALAGAPFAIALAAIPPFLMGPVFGAQWRPAGIIVSIMAPMVWIQLVASPVSQSLTLRGRLGLQLAWNAGRFMLVLAVLAVCKALGVGFLGTSAAYSGTLVFSYVLLLVLIDRASPRVLAREPEG